ncbi:hypothetical protein BV898_02955 [Hypsibius exemplaris]|uniref:Uncharacterized protein n=1 Tax=Hypsibius exemplaris TaxID=2072580 RepID=A0A1W0X738_HYPEX|nr:hypothetical protein BV898_02955 [Hypsibius exemplaris]
MSAGLPPASADAQARPSVDRPLNAILEDPDENKSATTDGGSFFSDEEEEDTISIPKFTPLASSQNIPAKITFTNSSFSNFIKHNSPVGPGTASTDSPAAATETNKPVKSPRLLNFDSFESGTDEANKQNAPKKMTRVEQYWDGDVLSPASAGSDHEESANPTSEDPFGFLMDDLMSPMANPYDSGQLSKVVFSESQSKTRLEPIRRLINPDSPPVGPSDLDIDFSGGHRSTGDQFTPSTLKVELETAKKEIATLLEAIHQKDLNVIDAQRKIEELQDDVISEKRDGLTIRQRLDTALVNANQLETKNVLLRTQIDEIEQESRSVAKSLRDVAVLLNMQSIPADDESLGVHVKAKLTSLLKAEAELTSLKAHRDDLDYNERNLVEDLANMRAALNTEKTIRSQLEITNLRNVEIRDRDILELQAKLNDASRQIRDKEELGHAVAAEARALTEELRDAHVVIDRKEREVIDLRSRSGPKAESSAKLSQRVDSDTFLPHSEDDAERLEQLATENRSLKEELASLRRKMIRNGNSTNSFGAESPKSVPNRKGLLRAGSSQPPDVVSSEPNLGGGATAKVKRELKVLNAALSQVISGSNSAIAKLKTENLALVGRLHDYERSEPALRQELLTRTKQLESLNLQLAESQVLLRDQMGAKTNEENREEPRTEIRSDVEWSGTTMRTLLGQLRDTIHAASIQRNTPEAPLTAQHEQIRELVDELRTLQRTMEARNTASASRKLEEDLAEMTAARTHFQEFIEKERKAATIQQDQKDDIVVLQKMLSEREDEIEHWRTVCTKLDRESLSLLDNVSAEPGQARYEYEEQSSSVQRYWPQSGRSSDFRRIIEHGQGPDNYAVILEQSSSAFDYDPRFIDSEFRQRSFSESGHGSATTEYLLNSFDPTTVDQIVFTSPANNPSSGDFASQDGRVPGNVVTFFRGGISSSLRGPRPSFELPVARRPDSAPPRGSLPEFDGRLLSRGYPVARDSIESVEPVKVHSTVETQTEINDHSPRTRVFDERITHNREPVVRLTLPAVDYEGIRLRSKTQLAQLEDLCRRIDQANSQYVPFLPNNTLELDSVAHTK